MAASVQDMGIDHDRADKLVPKEFLDGADVIACLKQMLGKGMSEGVATDMLNYACTADCFLDAPLNPPEYRVPFVPSNRLNMLPTLRVASIYPSTTLTYLVSI